MDGSRSNGRQLSYGKQCLDEDDFAAVRAVLESDYLTQGPAVRRFEEDLVRLGGAPHAVAVANGTVALELAYAALGVGPGSRVWTSANTFLASATAAVRRGGDVRFLDVEPRAGLIDPDEARARLESGERVDVLTVVHFAGRIAPMGEWIELKRRFGFRLVEDACHSFGARYSFEGRRWGPGEHPEVDAATLSFHPVKPVTTAEGGAVLTADETLADRLRLLACHGIDRTSSERPFGGSEDEPAPAWWLPMVRLGTNARLSDVHAALGSSQLSKLDRFLSRRREIAAVYREALADASDRWQVLDPGDDEHEHAWHLFCLRVDPEERPRLWDHLVERGILPQLHYYPVPLQPWFRERLPERSYPNAEFHARSSLSLPIYPRSTTRTWSTCWPLWTRSSRQANPPCARRSPESKLE